MPRKKVEMSAEQIEAAKTRLSRVLRRCGWTIHLNRKPSGVYAGAAKKDEQGQWHGKYIAPLYAIEQLETGKIIAMLPPIA